jgi:ABC-2 type transport system permease protein
VRRTLRGVGLVAGHELRTAWVAGLPVRVFVVLALVVGVALAGGWRLQSSEAEQRARYQQLVEQAWDGQPDRHPHRVAHYGYLAFRQRAPLAVFDPGVDSFAGTSVFLEAHKQNLLNFGEARQATSMLRFGELSPAYVFGVLLPLLIIALGFATVSGEREAGTLRLALAQGVRPGSFLAGKVVGLTILGTLTAGPVLALALLLPALFSPGPSGTAPPERVLLLAGLYLAYMVGWVLITVLVSSLVRSSRGALGALLAAWVVLCIGLPRVLPSLAGAAHPAPTRAAFEAEIAADMAGVGDSHNPNDPFFGALRQQYLEEHGVESVTELPVNWGGVVSREGERITSEIFEGAALQLNRTYRTQDRWSAWAGLVSPYMALRGLSMRVSGTAPGSVEQFRVESEAYRFEVIQRLNELHTTEIRFQNDRAQRLSGDIWQRFPTFEPRPLPLSAALFGEPLLLLALLFGLVWPAAALALAARTLPRA